MPYLKITVDERELTNIIVALMELKDLQEYMRKAKRPPKEPLKALHPEEFRTIYPLVGVELDSLITRLRQCK